MAVVLRKTACIQGQCQQEPSVFRGKLQVGCRLEAKWQQCHLKQRNRRADKPAAKSALLRHLDEFARLIGPRDGTVRSVRGAAESRPNVQVPVKTFLNP